MPCSVCHGIADYQAYQSSDVSTLPVIHYSDGIPARSACSTWPQIGEHLAALSRDFFEAINNRVFSATSSPWTATKDFRAIPEIANHDGQTEYDLEGHLAALRLLCHMHPHIHVLITDVTVHVSRQTRCAEVFVGHNTSGTEPTCTLRGAGPVVWQSMGLMEFHFEEGRWLLTRFRSMAGLATFDK